MDGQQQPETKLPTSKPKIDLPEQDLEHICALAPPQVTREKKNQVTLHDKVTVYMHDEVTVYITVVYAISNADDQVRPGLPARAILTEWYEEAPIIQPDIRVAV